MSKGKINLITKNLTDTEFKELNRVRNDVFFFSTFIHVIHPKRGKTRFNLYPFQKSVLWFFLTERFNIVLKFRQAGVTELIAMYCLWLAMYHDTKSIVILSIKDRVAKKVLRKIKYMYRNLPEHLKVQVVNGRGSEIGTATELEFSNGSIISSIPTTEDAGRSEGLSLLVIDEAAIIRWANQIWAAAFPTLSTGGASIVNSTPYGVGNWFHKTWVDATTGGNPFNPIRLHWKMHPERDQKWYDEMKASLGARRTAQEIDGSFLSSGQTVFAMADIRAIEEEILDLENVIVKENGLLRIYKKPEKDKDFFIGSDVATGRSQDYSTFSIMDRYGEEYASFKGRIPTNRLADLLMRYGKEYNTAILGPESNDIGLAVASKIEEQSYPRLYYATKILKEKGDRRPKEEKIPGWYTTKKNRPVIIDQLEEDIREKDIIIRDPAFCQEAYTFIYDSANRPVAMGKGNKNANMEEETLADETYTDDAIMGKAITNQIRKGKYKGPRTLPR